jgi:hypothetical protein
MGRSLDITVLSTIVKSGRGQLVPSQDERPPVSHLTAFLSFFEPGCVYFLY